jgi:hypothetical protein
MKHPELQELNRSMFSICDCRLLSETLGGISAKDRCAVLLSPLCVFAALQISHSIENSAIQELNRSLCQFAVVAPAKNKCSSQLARSLCTQQ